MTGDFDRAFEIVWHRENGGDAIAVSNNPNDPGAYTRAGIALNRHPELNRARLDAMTKADFAGLYKAQYWTPHSCDALPWPLSLIVFDGEVNAGGEGAMALQAVLGVKADGDIGPVTLAAARKRNPLDLAFRTCAKRDEYYRTLNTFPVFGTGWLIRLFQNLYDAGPGPAQPQGPTS